MIISSHLHPISNSQEFIPVTVCTYNGESKFIRVSENYGEFMDTVKTAFSIWSNPKLQIQTSSLGVCQGRNITVDDSAYPYIWKALEEVTVAIVAYDVKPILLEPDLIAPVAGTRMVQYAGGHLMSVVDVPRQEEEPVDSRLPTPPVAPSVPVKGRGRAKKTADDKKKATEEVELPVKKEKAPTKKAPKEGPSTTRKRGPAKAQNKAATASTSAHVEEEVVEEPEAPPVSEHDTEETHTNISPKSETEPDRDGRVGVTIMGPDGQLIKYAARPKHTIRKILTAACKNFEVDSDVARLDLVRLNDEGIPMPPVYKCEPEDVLGRLGIDDHTQLILRTDGQEEDDLFEDDPEEEPEQPQEQAANEDDEEEQDDDDALLKTRQFFNRQK